MRSSVAVCHRAWLPGAAPLPWRWSCRAAPVMSPRGDRSRAPEPDDLRATTRAATLIINRADSASAVAVLTDRPICYRVSNSSALSFLAPVTRRDGRRSRGVGPSSAVLVKRLSWSGSSRCPGAWEPENLSAGLRPGGQIDDGQLNQPVPGPGLGGGLADGSLAGGTRWTSAGLCQGH